MSDNTLTAKPVVKNQYWIVTNGSDKVGNVVATSNGFELKINGNKQHFTTTKSIEKITNIRFEKIDTSKTPSDVRFSDYPTPLKTFNNFFEVKRKLHIFTKTEKSKCYHVAGWFNLKTDDNVEQVFCPKYIIIQRYEYTGPYKSKEEAQTMLNT